LLFDSKIAVDCCVRNEKEPLCALVLQAPGQSNGKEGGVKLFLSEKPKHVLPFKIGVDIDNRSRMALLEKIYWIFQRYTDERERKVGRFFNDIQAFGSANIVRARMLKLMQADLIRFNLYQEYKFKAYHHLKKSRRRWLYDNADILKHELLDFIDTQEKTFFIPKAIKQLDIEKEKKVFLAGLLIFLSPERHFEYRESSAFSKLLRDPRKEKLMGDCNQICTLYLALYATRFPIDDWQIRILPGHVCLHYQGIDIEATNASTKHYKTGEILPVTEMISTNMLDISDKSERRHEIDPQTFSLGAKLVSIVSSNQTLAQKNLRIAYHNLGVRTLKQNNFIRASRYFIQAREPNSVQNVWKTAVYYYLKQKEFSKALKYAKKSNDTSLQTTILHDQAILLLKQKNFTRAEKLFRRIGDTKGQKAVWQNQLFELNKSLKNCKTIDDFRKKKSTLKKMKALSQKLNNTKAKAFCDDILERI